MKKHYFNEITELDLKNKKVTILNGDEFTFDNLSINTGFEINEKEEFF